MNSTETGHAPNRTYRDQGGEIHLNGARLYADGVQDNLTAHAGGGQANAVPLTAQVARVTTVATAADSVLLPASFPGTIQYLTNAGANSLNVFPQTGDAIESGGANAAYALAAGKTAIFVCTTAGQWYAISGT